MKNFYLLDAIIGSFQQQPSHQENDQNKVWECSREVDYFAAGLDALDQTKEDDDPGQHQTQCQLPIRSPEVSSLDAAALLEDFLGQILPRTGFPQRDRNVEQSVDRKLRARCLVTVADVSEDAGDRLLVFPAADFLLPLVPKGEVTPDLTELLRLLYAGPGGERYHERL